MYRIEHALGYQRSSVLHRIMTEGLQGASIPVPAGSRCLPADEVAERVEAAVIALPVDLRKIVVITHFGKGTAVQKARQLHLSYDAFRYRLRQARSMLADVLGV